MKADDSKLDAFAIKIHAEDQLILHAETVVAVKMLREIKGVTNLFPRDFSYSRDVAHLHRELRGVAKNLFYRDCYSRHGIRKESVRHST